MGHVVVWVHPVHDGHRVQRLPVRRGERQRHRRRGVRAGPQIRRHPVGAAGGRGDPFLARAVRRDAVHRHEAGHAVRPPLRHRQRDVVVPAAARLGDRRRARGGLVREHLRHELVLRALDVQHQIGCGGPARGVQDLAGREQDLALPLLLRPALHARRGRGAGRRVRRRTR